MLVDQNKDKYLITFTSRTGSILVSEKFICKFLLNLIQKYDDSLLIKSFNINFTNSSEVKVFIMIENEIKDSEYISKLRKKIKIIIEESFYLGTKSVLVGFQKYGK